jgi:hypothetical protein
MSGDVGWLRAIMETRLAATSAISRGRRELLEADLVCPIRGPQLALASWVLRLEPPP